jgi:hypothetical protein
LRIYTNKAESLCVVGTGARKRTENEDWKTALLGDMWPIWVAGQWLKVKTVAVRINSSRDSTQNVIDSPIASTFSQFIYITYS